MNPANLDPLKEFSVLVARQIPFGVLIEPLPLRNFDVILINDNINEAKKKATNLVKQFIKPR